MKKRYILLIFLGIVLGVLISIGVLFWAQVLPPLETVDFQNILEYLFPEEPSPTELLSEDAQRYYYLKNLSCGTLSENFLIVTNDMSQVSIEGLIESVPGEKELAEDVVSNYNFNQTVKTYVFEDQMKRVITTADVETTTVWKNGRIYNCTPDCVMRIMTENDSEYYYDMLDRMKGNCAYFGKTALPDSVELHKLFDVEYTGESTIGGFECDNFFISGNKTYVEELLATGQLDEKQTDLLWALTRFDGPVNECLDESTGIIVYRNITFDLTDSYLFNYTATGYMKINQQTTLNYFATDVPESFLSIPN